MSRIQHFKISGMRCEGCVAGVKSALEGVSGVTRVQVNLAEQSARVESDDSVSSGVLVAAVKQAGFEAQPAD